MTDITAQLSSEIITEILSFLDLRGFMNACLTCKRWNSWRSADYLWKDLYYHEFKPQTLYRADQYPSWQDQFKKHYSFKRWQKSEDQLTLSDEIWGAKFSPNGKYLAYAGKSGELAICEIYYKPDEQLIELSVIKKLFIIDNCGIGRLSWSPDSSKILVTCKNDEFGVVDLSTLIYKTLGSCNNDTHAHFLANNYIISSNEIYRYDEVAKEYIYENLIDLTRSDGKVERQMTLINDSSLLIGALSDAKKYMIYEYSSFSKTDWKTLYHVSLFPTAKIVDPRSKRELTKDDFLVLEEYGDIFGFCTTDDDKRLFVISKDMRTNNGNNKLDLRLWNLETKSVVRTWSVGETDLQFLLFPSMTPDDQIVLVGDYDGNVYIIHKEANEILHKFKAHDALVNYVTMHPTLDLLATASDTTELGLWTPTSSKLKVTVDQITKRLKALQ